MFDGDDSRDGIERALRFLQVVEQALATSAT
jgi:hypothetical protein